jgi:1,4-alpha-glucan branching enzyme
VTGAKPVGRATVMPKKEDKDKLANEIESALNNELATLREQLIQTEEELKQLKELPLQAELLSLREKLSQLEEANRKLSLDKEKVEHQVSTDREQKVKDLVEEMNFYKSEKEKSEKDKKRMELRLKQLEESL